ncbi:winged helix-turn-helix transcriptional regulator [Actinoplanes derwentensis]|uniref:HxlR-like helix-turn-helix n=1 Tax=Actinoplanes derwentensis TaxID=113562 RepID=A0A1H2DFB3_9ACTN|nr:winged helix-turn-helix transcriptional regulator [Actinoplanes derwentensis]GID84748.1 hypothetical protein Ade03nite_36720 [Actinoplanes derwentensis]SDT81182.1 HxlR-like helix-turn-helix [Actinoplanes derwentensis]
MTERPRGIPATSARYGADGAAADQRVPALRMPPSDAPEERRLSPLRVLLLGQVLRGAAAGDDAHQGLDLTESGTADGRERHVGRHHELGPAAPGKRNGMIERRVLPTSPVGVEYSLTPLGESLREPFGRLYDWTVANATEIQARQRDYDQRAPR